MIIEDADFQRIASSFFGGARPKLKDLGATDSDPTPEDDYATIAQMASLTAQFDAMSDELAEARKTATTAQAAAQAALSSAQARATSAAQTAQATSALSARVDDLVSGLATVQGALSGLHTAVDGKESAGVAASLLATHASAPNPHSQYLTQPNADLRYASAMHDHTIASVTGLQMALNSKDPSGAAVTLMSSHMSSPDPHGQYLNQTRADLRYSPQGHSHTVADVTTLQATLTALQGRTSVIQQPTQVTLPAISLGGNTKITVTWPTAMPHADYTCLFMFDMAATLVGSLSAALVPSSRTLATCQVTVKSSVLLVLGQAKLTVVGIAT